MTSPEQECTCEEPKKYQVWPNGDTACENDAWDRLVKVTGQPDLQSTEVRISCFNWKIVVLL